VPVNVTIRHGAAPAVDTAAASHVALVNMMTVEIRFVLNLVSPQSGHRTENRQL
jgi:hypothetical protein